MRIIKIYKVRKLRGFFDVMCSLSDQHVLLVSLCPYDGRPIQSHLLPHHLPPVGGGPSFSKFIKYSRHTKYKFVKSTFLVKELSASLL